MQHTKNILVVLLLAVISFFALSYRLDSVPAGAYTDEAVTGINAYSILKTGKDEYGKILPVAFRFFGSYSPPLYVYLTTIPIFFFGLNEMSARIISVFCGSMMILVFYGFLRNFFLIDKKAIPYCLFIFILTPWNFFFARTGYELYLGFFLFSLSSLFLWLTIKREKLIIPGLALLSLSTYGSYPQIYSVPVFLFCYLLIFFKDLNRRYLILGLLTGLLIQIPHLQLIGTNAVGAKGDLFYSGEIANNINKLPLPYYLSYLLSFFYSFGARIVNYFSPNSLFFFPDPDPQRSMPEISVFYNWMVVPYLTGIYLMLKNWKNKFSLFWIILTFSVLLPPSLTRDPFSTQRALPLLLPLFLLICAGISAIYKRLRYFSLIFGVIVIASAILLWRSYFILLPAERAAVWGSGYKEMTDFISKNPGKKFVIEQTSGKPAYANLMFYNKTDPVILQNSVDPLIKDNYYNLNQFNPDLKFENIETRAVVWETDIYKDQILIGDELAISKQQAEEHSLMEVLRIKDPRGYPLFIGYQTNPREKCAKTSQDSVFCQDLHSNTIDQ